MLSVLNVEEALVASLLEIHRRVFAHNEATALSVCVGLSGGLDSVVLLHALNRVASQSVAGLPALHMRAVYVNHQLSSNAIQWQTFCQNLCATLQIPFIAKSVCVQPAGKGVEDAARVARYEAFTSLLNSNEFLMTAHHADDQVETLLLRLNRGTGHKGLGGMSSVRRLGAGYLARPLLGISRLDLEQYAQALHLSHITDESNLDITFDRNYLRHKVVPSLQARWPEFQSTWGAAMLAARESDSLLTEYAEQDLSLLDRREEWVGEQPFGESISLVAFDVWSELRRKNLLRYWLSLISEEGITRQPLAEFLTQLSARQTDTKLSLSLGKAVLRVFNHRLYFLPVYPVELQARLLPNPSDAFVGLRLVGKVSDYRIATRIGGERCQPCGRHKSQQLKKLLQEQQVLPWFRENIPLVFAQETIAAVGLAWVCEGFEARPHKGVVGVEVVVKK